MLAHESEQVLVSLRFKTQGVLHLLAIFKILFHSILQEHAVLKIDNVWYLPFQNRVLGLLEVLLPCKPECHDGEKDVTHSCIYYVDDVEYLKTEV